MYRETTATKKIKALKKRIRFVNGGTSSSKTISILLILIDIAQSRHNLVISTLGESVPFLKRGVIRDFLNIMSDHKYYKDDHWNRSDYIYTFETGTIIEFFSADNPGKVRGPRRDIGYVNEGNNISYEVFTQFEIRTRDFIYVDSNPTHEYWMYTEIIPRREVDQITLTYRDNEALEKSIIESIESRKYNTNWYKVFGLGQLGEVEGKIYKGWQPLDDIPPAARLKRYGLDFGYSNDPTALVAIYVWNNSFIWDEMLYRKGLSNKDISDALKQHEQALVIADSAEPKSIDEIMQYGVSIIPSQKGKGSLNQGIQYVQDQTIYLTKRSINIWKEYRNYLWLTTKDGSIINEPQDFLNHALDAGRYGMESLKPKELDTSDLPDDTKKLFQGGFY